MFVLYTGGDPYQKQMLECVDLVAKEVSYQLASDRSRSKEVSAALSAKVARLLGGAAGTSTVSIGSGGHATGSAANSSGKTFVHCSILSPRVGIKLHGICPHIDHWLTQTCGDILYLVPTYLFLTTGTLFQPCRGEANSVPPVLPEQSGAH